MGKMTNLNGKATGKIGAIVYSVSGGQQIAREYQPIVANPNTQPQVENRSKLKLLSQLSANYAGSIAIRKVGLISGRNQFISTNYPQAVINGSAVNIDLNRVQLTKSNVPMIGFTADRSSGTKIVVVLNESCAAQFDKVVYSAFRKTANGNLMPAGSVVVEVAGDAGTFAGELPYTADAVVLYAYGVKINSGKANAAFSNLNAPTAEQVAKLYTTSSEVAAGTTLSQTAGCTMLKGETSADSDDVEHFAVSVIKSGNGSVSGGGRYLAGQTAVVTATPDAEATFVAWKQNSPSGAVVSTSATYSFEVDHDITLCAVFQGGPVPSYTIGATASPVEGGSVTGAGSYQEGATCTLVATPAAGFVFDGWFENGQLVSSNATYSFTVNVARNLVAEFAEAPETSFENVMIGSTPWTQNGQDLGSNSVSGRILSNATAVCFTLTQPQIGGAADLAGTVNVTNHEFTGLTPNRTGTMWLVGANYDSDSETYIITDIFEYTCTKS